MFDQGIPDDSRWRFSVKRTAVRLGQPWCAAISAADIEQMAKHLAFRLARVI
jgi:hypothetical protein